MYGHVTSSGNACLKFQRYLIPRNSLWRSLGTSTFLPCDRRWQSGAATRVEEDDYLVDTSDQDEHPAPAISRDIRPPLKIRHWRPHTAADLGVDVLGRPAEVLILPSRQHKAPRTALTETPSESHGIQESLASELQPVSWEDIARNLEAMRDAILRSNQESDIRDLTKVQEDIASGFSQKQLKQYIRRAMNTSSEEDFEKQLPNPQSKRNLAGQILTQLWNLKGTTPESMSNALDVSRFSKVFKSSRESLELVLLDRDEPLRHLSERHKVQVDIFRERSKIVLTGEQEAVLGAYEDLRQLARKPISYAIQLDQKTRELLDVRGVQDDFIQAFMQKYLVHLKREKDTLRVASRDKHAVNFIQRDLRMAANDYSHVDKFNFLPATSSDVITKIPIYPPPARNWFTEQLHWRRLSVQNTEQNQSERSLDLPPKELETISKRIFDSFKVRQAGQRALVNDLGVVRHDYSADLGRVLFNNAETEEFDRKPSRSSRSVHESSRSTFSSEIPLVPQKLSRMASSGDIVSKSSDFTIVLRLQPMNSAEHLPGFEILMTGSDVERGLRQPLQICKVSAIHRQQFFGLLLPHHDIDVRIGKNTTSIFFDLAHGAPPRASLPFLRSIALKLENAQHSEMGELPPLWTFDLTDVLQRSSAKSTPRVSPAKAPRKASQAASITDKNAGDDISSCTYMVEPPEFLDVCSYQFSSQSEYRIDHILANAGPTSLPRHPETLRVVGSPLSSSRGVAAVDPSAEIDDVASFQKFLKTAVDVAMRFSRQPGAQDKIQKS